MAVIYRETTSPRSWSRCDAKAVTRQFGEGGGAAGGNLPYLAEGGEARGEASRGGFRSAARS
jgi:hypothetical protein